ncbi:MAG: hypothetical protein SCH70_02625 [Candidatus Methanoperedens sp.]|nr:hypothetical protein [Candidatus Methanoperedens sp.]
MCPFHEKEDVKEDERGRISALAVGTFGALATITIVVITQNYGDDTTIKILLFSMFIVLISGFYGHGMLRIFKNYQKIRKCNKLAKQHFKIFRELVIRFREFTEDRMDNIQSVMHNIINSTPPPNPFHQINIIWPSFLQDRYNYYNERLNQFDGTKDSLVSLAKEFENILDMYNKLYINDPVKSIRNIERDKVPLQHKESYNKARIKYIDFLNSYKNFAKNANEDLVDKKNDDGFLGPNIIFKDYFDFPEEL